MSSYREKNKLRMRLVRGYKRGDRLLIYERYKNLSELLDQREQIVFEKYYKELQTQAAIAIILGVSPTVVQKLLRRITRKLSIN